MSDLPVVVYPVGEEHDRVVVGRFPFTKKYDAYAHAVAYSAMPEILCAFRQLMRLMELNSRSCLQSDDWLRGVASNPELPYPARESAAAILQGREALRKAEQFP